jgi:hypothetical protein
MFGSCQIPLCLICFLQWAEKWQLSAKVCILADFGSMEQFFELIARYHIRDTCTCGNRRKTNQDSSEICKGPETGVYKIEAAALQQWS